LSIRITVKDKGNVEFGVMSIPGRKSKCLYRVMGLGKIVPLAYFRDDQCAEEFNEIIDFIVDNIGGEYRKV
jgi:hypothetical protein